MQITYGVTQSTELMWILSWIFDARWDGKWLRKLDEETEDGGVDIGRLIARMRNLGDHELVTAPKYCGIDC